MSPLAPTVTPRLARNRQPLHGAADALLRGVVGGLPRVAPTSRRICSRNSGAGRRRGRFRQRVPGFVQEGFDVRQSEAWVHGIHSGGNLFAQLPAASRGPHQWQCGADLIKARGEMGVGCEALRIAREIREVLGRHSSASWGDQPQSAEYTRFNGV